MSLDKLIIILCCGLVPVILLVRAIYLIIGIYNDNLSFTFKEPTSLRTILCVGSGGHTSELMKILEHLNVTQYNPRLYVMADTDKTSEFKIQSYEGSRAYEIAKIPRSRQVNQSFRSSVVSTLYAIFSTVPIIYRFKPNIIFCNGPGTCIPICVVVFLMRILFILDCRIVFIESVCRVRTLSLTGKILQYFADVFIVQWPQLQQICFRSKYFGRLT